jgi:C-terminal processing protease CtpA/Prc
VLVDHGMCSPGETFAGLASQIRGAMLVGENTEGCGKYGNVDRFTVLPHSHVAVHFGRAWFERAGCPYEQGVGFFPDVWLDTAEPLAAIRQQLGIPAALEEP